MTHIYRATRMPDGTPLHRLAWIFDCPACSYRFAFHSEENAVTAATLHCRTAGGKTHDEALIDVLAATSPLFTGDAA